MEEKLFALKESLIKEKTSSSNCLSSLKKINVMLNEEPSCVKLLNDWGFMKNQFLYLLNNLELRRLVLIVGTKLLKHSESTLPSVLITKKAGFLFSEILYESLDDPNEIIMFCKEAIIKAQMLVIILYDCGFFILLNSVVSKEAAELYSAIFMHKRYTKNEQVIGKDTEDIMYEIKRKYFDSEIVFGNGDIFLLKEFPLDYTATYQICKNIFDNLYNTSFFDLLDLDLNLNLHLMNYCDWDYLYLCGSLDLKMLIINNEYLAIRIYRKMLDCLKENMIIYLNKIEDNNLIKHIIKILESKDKKIVMECVLILYNYNKFFELNWKLFTENRIRNIFELLEFICNDSCIKDCTGDEQNENCKAKKVLILLSEIYCNVPKEYFYKPSFLILINVWDKIFMKHKCWEFPFFITFYSDIIDFLIKNTHNFARMLFPFKNVRSKRKGSTLKLKDGIDDDVNSSDE